MLLDRLAFRPAIARCAHSVFVRAASSLVGQSGRTYIEGEVLHRQLSDTSQSIIKAQSGGNSFILKRVPKRCFDIHLDVLIEFPRSRRLRNVVDFNLDENVLVFPYYRDTLLGLMKKDIDFPNVERAKVLRHVAEAVEELHCKDWIHLDIKPDQILINWDCDGEGSVRVIDVVLGDFDTAFNTEGCMKICPSQAIGNVMWCSPEGHTGGTLGKGADIFSLGLLFIYALGGGSWLTLDNFPDQTQSGISPTQEIVTRHFCYFGLVTDGLLEHLSSDLWRGAFKEASEMAELELQAKPGFKFESWGSELGSEAVTMISGMTNMDPTARTPISQVLASKWWDGILPLPSRPPQPKADDSQRPSTELKSQY